MKKLAILSLFLVTVLASAQTTITKKIGKFSELKVYNGIDVELIKSDTPELTITGEKADKVKVKLVNNTLKISLKFPETSADGKAVVKLHYTSDLVIIDANEGSAITGKDINQQNVEIKAQEGAYINLVVDVKHLRVKSSSGAVIRLSGSSKNQTIDADLGGMYHGYKLKVTNMTVAKAGSGSKIEVHVGEALDAKVSFGGSIFYKGEPEVFKDKKVIGGVIEHRS